MIRLRGGLSVFVARDGSRASAFADALTFFAPELEVIQFPAWDCLPYDRVGPSAGVAVCTKRHLRAGVDGPEGTAAARAL